MHTVLSFSRRSPKRIILAASVVMLLSAAVASAYFTGSLAVGSNATSVASSLPQGNTPNVSISGTNVTVSWTQNSVGGQLVGAYTGGGYTVNRYPAAGGSAVTPGSACNTTISGSASTLSCTENNVPAGSWKYSITPILNSWTGAESGLSATVATATMSLSATSGHVGDTVTISGSNFPANSTITATYDGAALSLSGTTTTTSAGSIPSGVTFNVPASVTGSHTVRVTAGGQTGSASFAVSPAISLSPSSGGAGTSDSISGTGFAANTTVTATFGGAPVTLSGSPTTGSTGSFSSASYTVPNSAAGTYTVQISDGTSRASSSYQVTFGPAAQIVLSGSTADLGGGAQRTLTATIEDANGNTVTAGGDASDSVTFAQTSGTGTVTGLKSTTAVNGVATDIVTGGKKGSVSLQASAKLGGSSTATSSNTISFNVVPGTPTQLAFTPATPDSATAGSSLTNVAVSVEDAAGNIVTGAGAGSVTMSTATGSPQSGFNSGTTTVSASTGVASFTDLVLDKAGSYALSATSSVSGVTGATSNTFVVGPASFAAFNVAPATSTPTAGVAFNVTLTAQDAYGNTVPSYSGAECVTFAGASNSPNNTAPTYPAKGSCASGSSVNFASGQATGPITLTNASASAITLTATDNPTGKKGTASLVVGAGAPAALAFLNCTTTNGTSPTTCSASGGTTTITLVRNTNATWTANVGLVDTYGNAAAASSALTATVGYSVAGKAQVSYSGSGASSLAIAKGATSSSNTFTLTAGNGSYTGTVTATSSSGLTGTATLTTQ